MGRIRSPKSAKLFIGMLSAKEELFESAIEHLVRIYGVIDIKSPLYPWRHTDYYKKEMGDNLWRRFIFFKSLIPPESISDIKRTTNEIEKLFGIGKGDAYSRKINLDPGYLTDAKVVLATTKDYSHRIYLRDGIYGEVTLYFQRKTFNPLPYTYPDFRSEEYISLFNKIREAYFAMNPYGEER